MFAGKSVLVTGGTGSFGKRFIRTVLDNHRPRRLVVLSRDELKQSEMQAEFSPAEYPSLRYLLGNVRDKDRLYRAFDGIDIVVHAAALKQVPAAEMNPLEVIKTNVLGGANVVDAAIDRRVERVIALSTDKAANPVNLYGATKLCSDKLFVAGNHYVGGQRTRFAVVRYGNVIGSRGSVVPLFMKLRESGRLPITDERMTRFFITLQQGVDFVLRCLQLMRGGEIFVPKIPSMKVVDLARAIAPDCELDVVGVRPGEKLHEIMVTRDDARQTVDCGTHYVIMPTVHEWSGAPALGEGCVPCAEDFEYRSDTNDVWLSDAELRSLAGVDADETK